MRGDESNSFDNRGGWQKQPKQIDVTVVFVNYLQGHLIGRDTLR